MKKQILITRPRYDDATNYCFYYAGIVMNEASKRGIDIIDLQRPRLNRAEFTKIIQSKTPSFVFFNAHGDERTIYGDKIDGTEEALIEENKNHQLLNSKLVYARACLAAASLGKACKGGCFIGYTVPFSFWNDARWSTKPLHDDLARLFFDPSNLVVESLLKGNTAEEAANKSISLSKKTILKLLKESKEPGATVCIELLWNNMQGLEICGNEKMKFE